MQQVIEQKAAAFVDRRSPYSSAGAQSDIERRQFSDSRDTLRPEVCELSEAIDQYKLRHRRRFITFDELYDVIVELGYQKTV